MLNEAEVRLFGKRNKDFDSWLRLYMFRGGTFYGWRVAGHIVTLAAYGLTKRPRGDWGRYVNLWHIYTEPRARGKGFGVHLQRQLDGLHRVEGFDRLRTNAQSVSGVRLFRHLGYDFWGVNARGELVVDTPLGEPRAWPVGTPAGASMYPGVEWREAPLSASEVAAVVAGWP